jgi:hypothetical protein
MSTDTRHDTKRQQPPPAPAPARSGPRKPVTREECGLPADLAPGIPIAWIWLDRQLKLPGHPATDHVEAKTLPNGTRWEIEYIPQIRAHRVTLYPGDPGKEIETEMLHEGFVIRWKPGASKPVAPPQK